MNDDFVKNVNKSCIVIHFISAKNPQPNSLSSFHPLDTICKPLQFEPINSFKYCLTLFLLISTMSVIKLLSHIKFREPAQGLGEYYMPFSNVSFPSPPVLAEYEPGRITNPARFNYSLNHRSILRGHEKAAQAGKVSN